MQNNNDRAKYRFLVKQILKLLPIPVLVGSTIGIILKVISNSQSGAYPIFSWDALLTAAWITLGLIGLVEAVVVISYAIFEFIKFRRK